MRFLVTGGSGFVGQHLLRHLTGLGHETISWGLANERADATNSVDLRVAAELPEGDLRGQDAVIHLAGLAQVSESFAEPERYVSTNAGMQINLMEALLKQSSKARILVISTGGVYRAGPGRLTETSATEPANPYVISKLTQELLASYYMQRGLDVIIARPFNHFGPGQHRGYLVADLASQIAALERRGGGELAVGNLASERDYTDVRDVVAAYSSLIASGRSGATYNVCSGVSRTGSEIFETLADLATVQVTAAPQASLQRPTDSNQVAASNERIRRDTGWQPQIPLDAALADTLAYWREQQPPRSVRST